MTRPYIPCPLCPAEYRLYENFIGRQDCCPACAVRAEEARIDAETEAFLMAGGVRVVRPKMG
jgi:uncharacterized protein (DUF983 family)